MKKVLSLLFVAGAMSLVSCGPSADQVAKEKAAEKAKMDSIFNLASQGMTNAMDSTATKKDSVAAPKK